MADLMTREQYEKACSYRMRETLENLQELWEQAEDEKHKEIIPKTLAALWDTIDELQYFQDKLENSSLDPAQEEANMELQ